MPFAFLVIGSVMLVAGVRKHSGDLWTLVKGDFSGRNNFVYWCIAILILGGLGYVNAFRPLSRAFLVLVIVVLILANGGFFQLFNQALSNISTRNSQS